MIRMIYLSAFAATIKLLEQNSVSFSPLSIRMLVFGGTLLIVLKLGSKARNDFEYLGQPSRFIHLFDANFLE